MKFGLYWQILLGIIIGVSFGLLFPTSYKITDQTISEFQKIEYPQDLAQILKSERKEYSETEAEFLIRIQAVLSPEYFDKYKTKITARSKFNPYLHYISWLGELFFRLLAMITVPIVISAIISSLSGIGSAHNLGKLGIKTFLYYITSSLLAVTIALFFVNISKPGIGNNTGSIVELAALPTYSVKNSIMEIIPRNIFDAFSGSNMISVIFFSVLFGFFVTRTNDRNRVFISNFFISTFEVIIQISKFIIKLIPLGIIGIMATFVADQGGSFQKITSLFFNHGDFLLTLILAFSFHGIVILPVLLKFVFKAEPWRLFLKVRAALITGFFTSSSLTTLPITIQSINKSCGVSNKISCFTLPLGATVKMDGTALYQLISVFYIAQVYGMQLSLIETIVVVAITLLTSIGSSSIPLSGIYILSIVLTAVGIPIEGIGLLLAIDIPIKMLQTTFNVWSDCCGAVIIAKSEGEELNV